MPEDGVLKPVVWRLGQEDHLAEALAPCSVVTIGVFDGVHRGHQSLIRAAVSAGPTAVFTLHPPPLQVLHKRRPAYVQSIAQRVETILSLGAARCVVIDFSRDFATLTGTEFIDRIVQMVHPQLMWLGYDFKFGSGAEGSAQALKKRESRFTVRVSEPLQDATGPVSSTRVRVAVQEGRLSDAAGMLGRDFALDLRSGVQRSNGRYTIEQGEQVLPPPGIYDVTVMPQHQRAEARVSESHMELAIKGFAEQVLFHGRATES